MTANLIAGKRRPALSAAEKQVLKAALHTEAILTGDREVAVRIRHKLGLGPLAFERAEEVPGHG